MYTLANRPCNALTSWNLEICWRTYRTHWTMNILCSLKKLMEMVRNKLFANPLFIVQITGTSCSGMGSWPRCNMRTCSQVYTQLNRSNTENIVSRPVMSLLQLPLTNEPNHVFLSPWVRISHLRCDKPISLILCTALPLSYHPMLPPSTSIAFFITLQFSDLVPYVLTLKTFTSKRATCIDVWN